MTTSLFDLLVILGPTASGKTTLATNIASKIDAEIISADSRQVYRRMDLGTGKDLSEYTISGKKIPYHLIDIKNPGYKYNVYEFQKDFYNSYSQIKEKNKPAILCGGTGLYIESIIKKYNLTYVPPNKKLRDELEKKTLKELTTILKNFRTLHNSTDTETKKRAIRAIEIATFYKYNPKISIDLPKINPLLIGINIERDKRRQKITQRLNERIESGMIEEVGELLSEGIKPEDLIYYGLEYKYLTLHLIGELDYDEMIEKLNIAIHQFAKRQMTWFRGMEKRGTKIQWIDESNPIEENADFVINQFLNHK